MNWVEGSQAGAATALPDAREMWVEAGAGAGNSRLLPGARAEPGALRPAPTAPGRLPEARPRYSAALLSPRLPRAPRSWRHDRPEGAHSPASEQHALSLSLR